MFSSWDLTLAIDDIPAGTVAFASQLRDSHLEGVTASFDAYDSMAWIASLAEPANSEMLREVFLRHGGNGRSREVYRRDFDIDPSYDVLTRRTTAASLHAIGVHPPGVFTLRISRGHDLLAEGTFALTGKAVNGTIVFGAAVHSEHDFLQILAPHAIFEAGESVAWIAYYARPDIAGPITRAIRSRDGREISNTVLKGQKNRVQHGDVIAADDQAPGLHPGEVYDVIYVQDGQPIASGEFVVVTREQRGVILQLQQLLQRWFVRAWYERDWRETAVSIGRRASAHNDIANIAREISDAFQHDREVARAILDVRDRLPLAVAKAIVPRAFADVNRWFFMTHIFPIARSESSEEAPSSVD